MKNPYKLPCVVSLYTSNDKSNDGSGSGILIDADNGYILTNATSLAPLAVKHQDLRDLLEKPVFSLDRTMVQAEVIFERDNLPNDKNVYVKDIQTALTNSNSTRNKRLAYHNAEVLQVFTCPTFSDAFHHLLGGSNWTFVTDEAPDLQKPEKYQKDENAELYQKIIFILMPKFILLKVSDLPSQQKTNFIPIKNYLSIHDKIEVCATPFGNLSPDVFMNSWSTGIVSNVHGKDCCLILTDARCVPGSEGGPVFCVRNNIRKLAGLVVSSLCWKSNEWVGLSIVCSITDILSTLSRSFYNRHNISQNISNKDLSKFSSVLDQVVLVKDGNTWGSGVIIYHQPVYILTCSHVVKGCKNSKISIKYRKSFISSEIIYQESKQFDLAVLEVPSLCLHSPIKHPIVPIEGMRVYAVGHAIFGHKYDLAPTVTSGVISKVIYVNSIPVMIQTTCAVHPGASGGALVNEDGYLVGIIVSNTKDIESGACFPHLSLCIPVVTVWPVLSQFFISKDESILNKLCIQNKYINELWSLGNPNQYPETSSKL